MGAVDFCTVVETKAVYDLSPALHISSTGDYAQTAPNLTSQLLTGRQQPTTSAGHLLWNVHQLSA